jgi:hypothetical protein
MNDIFDQLTFELGRNVIAESRDDGSAALIYDALKALNDNAVAVRRVRHVLDALACHGIVKREVGGLCIRAELCHLPSPLVKVQDH